MQESAVAALGYTAREAAFLTRVTRHGGYFVRRQFLEWIGRGQGQTIVDFTTRLVVSRHATVHTFCRTTHVYHLAAKALYEGLDAGPALRRRRPTVSIKARLMALDVATVCPDVTFLATEAERVAFCDALGVARGHLPQWHPPATAASARARYFPDSLLIGGQQGKPTPRLVCAYIDDGTSSSPGFESYLRRHARLLAAVPTTRLIYVSDAAPSAASASLELRRALAVDGRTAEGADADDPSELREFFGLRQAYDGHQWGVLDTAKLERLRALRRRFKTDVEGVYERWLVGGESVFSAAFPLHVETLVLPHSYAALGSWQRRS